MIGGAWWPVDCTHNTDGYLPPPHYHADRLSTERISIRSRTRKSRTYASSYILGMLTEKSCRRPQPMYRYQYQLPGYLRTRENHIDLLI